MVLSAEDFKRLRDEAPAEWRELEPPPLIIRDGKLQIGDPEHYGVIVGEPNVK